MRNHVLSYLDRNYFISTSDIGNDGIYSLDDTRSPIDRPPIDHERLLTEIHDITGISHAEIKELVNEWAFLVKKDVDLAFYWLAYRDLIK